MAGSPSSSEPLSGVSDFRGRPVYRGTSGGWRSALFVAVTEIASTFAYYGVSANLITYLTGPLGQSNASAAAAVNAWSGTASLLPLAGAFLADSVLGRYRSMLLACSLYALGYGMLTLASSLPAASRPSPACIDNAAACRASFAELAFFYISLYLVAIAYGADKPCGLAFGADQFDSDHPKECASRSSLFNWWYFSMAIGIAVAIAVVSYIQENVGWAVGFGAPFAIMLCALVVFLVGTPTYRLYAPSPDAASPFARLARSLLALGRTSFVDFKRRPGPDDEECSTTLLPHHHHHDDEEDEAGKAEEARGVLRLLPIWATCLAYGVAFAQIMTLFNKQGRKLDRRIAGLELELPPAALQTLGPLTILVFVPIYDRALVPALRRATGNPRGLTTLQRMGTGMALSAAAVAMAAVVEGRRLQAVREQRAALGWEWLVPQYVAMGVADVFAVVGMQEFFHGEMPAGLRSLGLALYFSVMGIGGFISSLLISLIDGLTRSGGGDGWFADDLDRGHLDYFYWLLAGLSAGELALFLCFATSYAYRNLKATPARF